MSHSDAWEYNRTCEVCWRQMTTTDDTCETCEDYLADQKPFSEREINT